MVNALVDDAAAVLREMEKWNAQAAAVHVVLVLGMVIFFYK